MAAETNDGKLSRFKWSKLPKTEAESEELICGLHPRKSPPEGRADKRRIEKRRYERARCRQIGYSRNKTRMRNARHNNGHQRRSWTPDEMAMLGWRKSRAELACILQRSRLSVDGMIRKIRSVLGDKRAVKALNAGRRLPPNIDVDGFRRLSGREMFKEFYGRTRYSLKTFRPWDTLYTMPIEDRPEEP
jgi:hypothetical protein